MGVIQFNVTVGEKTQPIHVQESAGVDELFRKVSTECANDVNPEDIMLVFGGVHLEYNKDKCFEDYSLVHMSMITLLLRLHGGLSSRVQGTVNRVVQLKEIPTWKDFYDMNTEKLIKCLLSKDEKWRQEIKSEYNIDPEFNSKVSLFEGDITTLQVDGIVSSTDCDLPAAPGANLRIKTVTGKWFDFTRDMLTACQTGKAMTTQGYNLPARYVVHTVGPQKVEPELLESCYRNCLEEMDAGRIKSLAFPCISTGVNEYPSDKAVLVALKTVRAWLEEQKCQKQLDKIERIIFCPITPVDVLLYRTWMQVFYPCPAAPKIVETVGGELLPLPGFIETTTTEPDMLGLDFESPVLAKMPCGHVIGPLSMTDYCRDLLKKGRYRFFCPSTDPKQCNREWEYFLVRHVARLTPEELQEVEKQVSKNYLKKAQGMQQCPGCQIWCLRAPDTGTCVRCQMCTNVNGKRFDFCWWCLNTWKADNANQPCGNTGCDGRDARLKTLEMCPTKKINMCDDCPSIRGCPKCGILIEHKEKCGHMDCTNCGDYGFCFICLAEKKNGKWQCSPWNETCDLAPRQTTLPGSR